MNFLPIGINIEGRRILIIGGGKVGHHKAQILSRFTDKATVIAKEFRQDFSDVPFETVHKEYEPSDLDGAFMVYVCTEDEALNRRIKSDAASRGVLASVCDAPSLCDFISPAIYREGNMTVAVSSDGKDVRRSIRLRNSIKEKIEDGTIDIV